MVSFLKLITFVLFWILISSVFTYSERLIKVHDSSLKIINVKAVNVRASTSTSSEIKGLAYKDYQYPILDKYISHYKIALPNGSNGWISAGKKFTPFIEVVPDNQEIESSVKKSSQFVDPLFLLVYNNLNQKVNTKQSTNGIWDDFGLRKIYRQLTAAIPDNLLSSFDLTPSPFVSGPHKGFLLDLEHGNATFGHYNPHFLAFLDEQLTIILKNPTLKNYAQWIYDSHFKATIRALYFTYYVRNTNRSYAYRNTLEHSSYVLHKISKKINEDHIMFRQYNIDLFETVFAYQYWSRRHIDGSKKLVIDLITKIFNAFDDVD